MAVTRHFYNNFLEDIGLGRMNLSADTFKCMLVHGYVFDATHTAKADITGEVSSGNGYTSGGEALQNMTWGYDVDDEVTRWDADDVVWTADGADLGPFTGAIIYNDSITTPEADRLVMYIDFGQEEQAGDETQFKVIFNANGVWTVV